MNYIDLFILLILIVYGVYGYVKGFFRVFLNLLFLFVSLFMAFLLSNGFSNVLRSYISVPPNILKVLSFLIILVIFEIIFTTLSYFIYKKIPENLKKSSYNKGLGAPIEVLRGIFVVSILLIIIMAMPASSKVKEDVSSSKIGGFLVNAGSGIERKFSPLLGNITNETLTLLIVKPGTDESVDLKFKTGDLRIDEESEKKMLDLVNQEREKRGMGILTVDEETREVARAHSRDMFERGYFSHENPEGETPFDRMIKAGVKFITAGENLALAPNVELAHQGLMDSPGHRENILNPEFGKVGIGCQDGGIYGKMFTQNFTD